MMEKCRTKFNNKGITLIALIITIILLTILTGVTVEVVDKNLINKARKVVDDANNKYESDQNILKNTVNDWEGTESTSTKSNTSSINNAPTLTVTVKDITATTAQIVAVGVDKDGDTLNYEVSVNNQKYGPSLIGTFDIKSLNENTTYHYIATVTDGIDSTTVEGEFTTAISNVAPYIETNEVSTRTPTSISINVKATDDNSDNLIYKLYTSTEKNGTYTLEQTSSKTVQDKQITLTASSLSEYTTYWWYIEVSDGKAITASEKGVKNAKTKCSGASYPCYTTSCSGTRTTTCYTCNGNGTTTYSCSGENDCSCCGGTGKHALCGTLDHTEVATQYKCTAHGNHPNIEYYACGHSVIVYSCPTEGAITENCQFRGVDPCFDIAHSSGGDCANCDGYGYTTPCSHGYSSAHEATKTCRTCNGSKTITRNCTHGTGGNSHKYCSHYTNTSISSHKYCAHNKMAEHD